MTDLLPEAGQPERRIMIVQYAGDFREAHRRLQATGEETYYGHRYIFEQLERIREDFGEVAIVCCLSPERYHETLPGGLTVIGAMAHPQRDIATLEPLMASWNPTHLIVLGPLTRVIRWGLRTNRRVTCQFADSFEFNPILRFAKFGRLAKLLNDPRIGWISNHGTNACKSLIKLGVDPGKVIAWDWPYQRSPAQTPPRQKPPGDAATLLYVGTVQTKKGVGDAIAAVARLRSRGRKVKLTVVGGGQIEQFRAKAASTPGGDGVEFLGIVPNNHVFDLMKEAEALIVPSRHDYPEGLPLTIYEALCARTPIIASDHPMFRGHLVDRETALIFRAKDILGLADGIEALLDEPELYPRLSHASQAAWERLQNPVKWGDVLYRWISDAVEDRAWLHAHAMRVAEQGV
jgi:glycosyltransferase involved in cell wall biosynthesis